MISIYNSDIKNYSYSAEKAIKSGWISNHGEYIKKSSEKLKEILGVKHVILMSNGTSATHCLFISLKYIYPNIKKIYIPNNCYIAAWNCALMEYDKSYLEVMKMDINTWNIKTDEEYIKTLESNSAILIVHNLGNIINVPRLKRIRPDIIFIEDNCEGFTGKYENIYSGTSISSLCSSISFYGNKIITTGEGGAFITNDDNVYNHISKVYSQGMSDIRYLHYIHAYNYRMTNIQAAFLYDQLNDLENILDNKKCIFDNYKILLEPIIKKGYITLFDKELNTHEANWIFSLRLLNNNKSIEETINYFKENNIDIRPFFYPINEHKHLSDINFEDDLPKLLNNSIIMIPSSPTITYQEQKKVINCINDFLKNYKFIEINNTNIYLLKEFISLKEIPNTFRYFKKNNIDIIKNHIITFLLYENNKIAGYFHIDYEKEDNTYWFGLCILPLYQNKRYGTKIMEYIFNHPKIINISNIKLSVDNDNIYAIKLYKNFGFNILNKYEKTSIMIKDIKCSLNRQINR
jgi:perosamine synthetase